MQRRHALLAAVLASGLVLTVPAGAQPAAPKPPLKIVVGFPPGGSADLLARLLADALKDDFSSVVVDNRPGAGGRIALSQVKRSPPDGHTVIVLPSGPMVLYPHVYRKLDYDPVADFTPISLIAHFQFGVVAGPAAGVGSLAEMLAKARSAPGPSSPTCRSRAAGRPTTRCWAGTSTTSSTS
jgi:tripartite-type tricarboxylate transporter receptor subunit TctC